MNNQQPPNNSPWSRLALLIGVGGFVFGSWLERKNLEESKKSRAELESPEEAEEVYVEIGDLLNEWQPEAECVSEEDYNDDLANYLDANTDWMIEVRPDTEVGCPDILIGGLIAIELKTNHKKNEQDRCIGQCLGYSELWITWIVLIDAQQSKVDRLNRKL